LKTSPAGEEAILKKTLRLQKAKKAMYGKKRRKIARQEKEKEKARQEKQHSGPNSTDHQILTGYHMMCNLGTRVSPTSTFATPPSQTSSWCGL
jgi:hypothetical protein